MAQAASEVEIAAHDHTNQRFVGEMHAGSDLPED